MWGSMQMMEFFVEVKRDEIERLLQRQKVLAEIGQPKSGLRSRHAVAGALMHIAMIIDDERADGRVDVTAAQ